MIDRCAAAKQEEVRRLFGVEPIEAHHKAGDQLRRAFYVDGYGKDVIAITFIRARGEEPAPLVHVPREADMPAVPVMKAPVPLERWNEVLARSRHFDRKLQPLPRALQKICLHSWVFTVEATDNPADGRPAPAPRRTVEDACLQGLAVDYATFLYQTALELMPHCRLLDPDQHRNEAMMLASCGRLLRGDRFAAALAANKVEAFSRLHQPGDLAAAKQLFAYRATLDWNGEKSGPEPQAAAGMWMEKVVGERPPHFFPQLITGESADRVHVVGKMVRSLQAADRTWTVEEADAVLIWTEVHGGMQIESATVGPFTQRRAVG